MLKGIVFRRKLYSQLQKLIWLFGLFLWFGVFFYSFALIFQQQITLLFYQDKNCSSFIDNHKTEDDCQRQTFQSVMERFCTTSTLSRHVCRMLKCKSIVPLCSADPAPMPLAPNFSDEQLLLPCTSLNRGIIS